MTARAFAVVAVLGVLVWVVCALVVVIAICGTIREAERRRVRPAKPAPTVVRPEPATPVHLEVYREWLDDGDPSAIRPPATPTRFEAWS